MTKQTEENIYENLRKPGTQAISLITLFFVLFTGLIFAFGLKLENAPNYLLASTAFQIIIALIGFIPLLYKTKPNNYGKFVKRLTGFSALCIISVYNLTFTVYNIYFYLAAQHGVYLFKFWIIGTLTMIICYGFQLMQQFTLLREPEKFKGESENDKFLRKMIFLFMFKVLSYIVFIQKIIEYFTIPNIAESRFTIIVVGVLIYAAMVFCSNVLYQSVLAYIEFKEEGKSNEAGHANYA
ncbi:DUF5079 family protein [Staphylococcus carnosus]|uniref:Membrane protein n=1 Tax=Staphylococcus carnosus (strain TM300) TaxID=396513 RepID=B9DLE7_STACT|nr:DUF5079 family protein [Staphylococcus carnosus]KOR11823.1 hypothetical protein AMC75_12165 [Staphylococcus carnosus]QPT03242.1 DUF5079 family protein [Staphylococcus carnosus]UQA68245.1 DUF5079 family protein [Staphylococcus carnosus]UTB79194.1 hypothetical protein A2I62_11825 [Staphylococcus carnosus]UTB81576.1 hypothetical protein A2I65_12100 [Staphylococcus carnosus]